MPLKNETLTLDHRQLSLSARLGNSVNQGINPGVYQTLTFNTTRWDTPATDHPYISAMVSGNNLVAPVDGMYMIGGNIEWSAAVGGYRGIRIRDITTPATWAFVLYDLAGNWGPTNIRQNVNTIVQCTAGQTFSLQVIQNSGGVMQIIAASRHSPEFWMTLLHFD